MTTKSKYFKITINAKNKEEMKMKVAENESRGFELIGIYPVEKVEHVYSGGEYRGLNTRKGCRAVMQRENKEESQ